MKFFKLFAVFVFLFSSDIFSQGKTNTVDCFQIISGTVREKPFNKTLKNATVKLFKETKLIKIITSNNKGQFNFKVDCDASYFISTKKDNYSESKKNLITSNTSNIKVEVVLYLKQKKSNCTEIFNGRVSDEFTNIPIEGVTVEIKSKNNKLIASDITNSNGNYHFNLPCNQQYLVFYTKKGYIDTTTEIKTTKTHKKVQRRDITLHLKLCNQKIKGTVFDAETNNPIENSSLVIFENDIQIKKINTDSKGFFRFGAKCGYDYLIKILNTDYEPYESTFHTSAINNKTKEFSIKLQLINKTKSKVVPLKKIERNLPTFEINPFKFELNSYEITKNIAIELDKVVGMMLVNPDLKVELNSHTDSRGPDGYNLNLTDARVQSMMSYLIGKGIDASRISGKGYGDTKLLNDCSKGKRCSERQHQINKRIEIIIKENESI